MANIAAALAQVKSEYSTLIDAPLVERLCREAGHEWRGRERAAAATEPRLRLPGGAHADDVRCQDGDDRRRDPGPDAHARPGRHAGAPPVHAARGPVGGGHGVRLVRAFGPSFTGSNARAVPD